VILATSGPSAYWYATRGTGVVALLLLTTGVLLGVLTSTRWSSPRWPRFVVSGLHRNLTLLALAFVVVHVVTTILDGYAPIGIRDAVVPFVSHYRPIWLGLGAVAFDLLLALIVTSLARGRIGLRSWKLVHWLAYASWPVALLHAFGTGSDARAGWFGLVALGSAAAVVLAVLWRVAAAREGPGAARVVGGLPPWRCLPPSRCGSSAGRLRRVGPGAPARPRGCSRPRRPPRRTLRPPMPRCRQSRSRLRSPARFRPLRPIPAGW